MRIINALKADIRFQWKQGFFYVYTAITVMYLIILSFLPQDYLKTIVPIVIFSDPSILGLFFIGGILMLEKVQGVMAVMVVTPLRSEEYILSKVLSLTLISMVISLLIAWLSHTVEVNWLVFVITIIQTSCFFTLCGIMISAGCHTINQYFLKSVPYMILFTLPCASLIGFQYSQLFEAIPSVAALRLMLGAFTGIPAWESAILIVYLTVLNYVCFRLTLRIFEKRIIYQD